MQLPPGSKSLISFSRVRLSAKSQFVPISDEKIDENEKAELRKDPRLKIILRSHQSLLHPENLPQAIPDFVISRFVTPAAALQCNKRN